MSHGLVTAAYIISAVLFILALAGLSKQETAKRGNLSGIIGMIIALIATIFGPQFTAVGFGLIVAAMIIGAIIGIRLALKVEMTSMLFLQPQKFLLQRFHLLIPLTWECRLLLQIKAKVSDFATSLLMQACSIKQAVKI